MSVFYDGLKALKTVRSLHSYILDRLGLLKNHQVKYTLWEGTKYVFRSNKFNHLMFNEIHIHGVYTLKNFQIHKNWTIIDIGAHVGFYSIYAAKKANFGKVYAFEPVTDNCKQLVNNIEINALKNIVVINKAVTQKTGYKKIFIHSYHPGMHSFYPVYFDKKEKNLVKVATISLNDIIKNFNLKKINILKMDCEGSEYEIIFSSPTKIFKIIDRIALEFHPLDSKRNEYVLREFLKRRGYHVELNYAPIPVLYAWKK